MNLPKLYIYAQNFVKKAALKALESYVHQEPLCFEEKYADGLYRV